MRHYLWLMLLLVMVVAFGVGGALMLSLKEDGVLQHEAQWVEALLQAGLIATFGIVTSGILEHFKDTLQQRRDESKLRFHVLAEVSRAYMDVKLIRRKLQAGEPFSDRVADRLNQIQVVIELHKRNSIYLFKQGEMLQKHLYDMEHYLNKVANKPSSTERTTFNDAEGFELLSKPYGDAASLILNEISGPRRHS